jgi:hypothetical protein
VFIFFEVGGGGGVLSDLQNQAGICIFGGPPGRHTVVFITIAGTKCGMTFLGTALEKL